MAGNTASHSATSFHVSPSGNDRNPGTKLKPFKTLQRARNAIRAMGKRAGLSPADVTVILAGGIHTLGATLKLAEQDSGRPGAPVVYRSGAAGEARLVGGRVLKGFKPVTNRAVLARLPKAARRHVRQISLKRLGIRDYGRLGLRGFGPVSGPAPVELFFNGVAVPLAGWPKRGFLKIASVPMPKGLDLPAEGGIPTDRFHYRGDRPTRWRTSDDLWVHGYWTYDWADRTVRVRSIDTAKRLLVTHAPHGLYGYRAGQRFRFLNVLEELSRPGEWFLDRKTGTLYFWPPSPIEKGEALLSTLKTPLVSMQGASHVQLIGLTLEGGGDAVHIASGENNLIAGCVIRNVGGNGVVVEDGTGHTVQSCDISQTGEGGIRLTGGDRKTLRRAGHVVRNNHIHHFARSCRTYRPAVAAGGVGITISHNLIHDAPHAGIIINGNDHTIEFNEIHHLCYETGDVGAFYMGRDWSMRGNVVRHNYFHDLGGLGYGSMAVYLDDCASGAAVVGNVFCRAGRGAFIGGGRDNIVENNLFIDCHPSVHVDARGLTWMRPKIEQRLGTCDLVGKIKALNYRKPPYATRYPKLAAILDGDPKRPDGNRVLRNLSIGGEWLHLENVKKSWVLMRDNLVRRKASRGDPSAPGFRLPANHPARKRGFKDIPVERIGLQVDEHRRALPKR